MNWIPSRTHSLGYTRLAPTLTLDCSQVPFRLATWRRIPRDREGWLEMAMNVPFNHAKENTEVSWNGEVTLA